MRLVALSILGVAACGTATVRIQGKAPAGRQARDDVLLAEVSRLRQLCVRRQVVVHYRDAPARTSKVARAPNQAARLADFLVAFGLESPWFGDADVAQIIPLIGSLVAGTYGDQVAEIRLGIDDQHRDDTVVHEITHALQDQHFHLAELQRAGFTDRGMAARALVEGDAQFTSLLWSLLHEGRSMQAAVLRLGAMAAAMHDRGIHTQQLEVLPTFLRDLLVFPYVAGVRLVGMIHAAGGYPLVNRMYRSPPRTTEQVLHPQKYVDGEPPIVVPAPQAPAGWHEVLSGTLGELGVRALLERCLGSDPSRRAAEGWGGDRFVIVANADGRLGLLWSTAWDREVDATEFAAAMWEYGLPRCGWSGSARKERFSGWTVVRREGTRVAVTRGLEETRTSSQLAEMLAAPVAIGARRPPLGRIVLHEEPPPPRPQLRLVEKTYRSTVLGIEGDVPEGYFGSMDLATGDFEMPWPARLVLRALKIPSNEGTLEHLLSRVPFRGPGPVERSSIDTLLGRGISARFETTSHGRARITLLPLCGGEGSLLIACGWREETGETPLLAFIGSLHRIEGAAPFCSSRQGPAEEPPATRPHLDR